ncbi:hypothetical protein PD885_02846 [Xanthomonas fragariae]|uniref:Uncharacterized protein n=1 Tax=Xanthomonas fragariae TaxID=48664 RepID=A0ABY1RS41_9XANT|nr:hypothetical protein PD885_02846 [Xanthomonas fragariae]
MVWMLSIKRQANSVHFCTGLCITNELTRYMFCKEPKVIARQQRDGTYGSGRSFKLFRMMSE